MKKRLLIVIGWLFIAFAAVYLLEYLGIFRFSQLWVRFNRSLGFFSTVGVGGFLRDESPISITVTTVSLIVVGIFFIGFGRGKTKGPAFVGKALLILGGILFVVGVLLSAALCGMHGDNCLSFGLQYVFVNPFMALTIFIPIITGIIFWIIGRNKSHA